MLAGLALKGDSLYVSSRKGIGMKNDKAARTRGPGISGSTSFWYQFWVPLELHQGEQERSEMTYILLTVQFEIHSHIAEPLFHL